MRGTPRGLPYPSSAACGLELSKILTDSFAVADLGEGPGGPDPLYFGKKRKQRGKKSRQDKQNNPAPPPLPTHPALSSRSGSATDLLFILLLLTFLRYFNVLVMGFVISQVVRYVTSKQTSPYTIPIK